MLPLCVCVQLLSQRAAALSAEYQSDTRAINAYEQRRKQREQVRAMTHATDVLSRDAIAAGICHCVELMVFLLSTCPFLCVCSGSSVDPTEPRAAASSATAAAGGGGARHAAADRRHSRRTTAAATCAGTGAAAATSPAAASVPRYALASSVAASPRVAQSQCASIAARSCPSSRAARGARWCSLRAGPSARRIVLRVRRCPSFAHSRRADAAPRHEQGKAAPAAGAQAADGQAGIRPGLRAQPGAEAHGRVHEPACVMLSSFARNFELILSKAPRGVERPRNRTQASTSSKRTGQRMFAE